MSRAKLFSTDLRSDLNEPAFSRSGMNPREFPKWSLDQDPNASGSGKN
jgi:hypothetical protein